jgi:RNA polymerase sigma-70 factor (ECF subfamily)
MNHFQILCPGPRSLFRAFEETRRIDKSAVNAGNFFWIPDTGSLCLPGCSIVSIVSAASSQPGDLVLPQPSAEPENIDREVLVFSGVPSELIQELWVAAEAATCGLTQEELGAALSSVGAKLNYGFPPEGHPNSVQKAAFFRALRLSEFALAQACALGHEVAWQRFMDLFRASLTQAAIGITGSATLGHELSDSLYSELYGLREVDGRRKSPLASYSGRGSLLGWLRTTLAQRHIDHHRRSYRETALDTLDVPAPAPSAAPIPAHLVRLTDAVTQTFAALPPEDRFLLGSYFLDRQTLLQIARVLRVHEATISRRLKRLMEELRKQILDNLQSGGLSRRAAEEALGTDPRDVEINLRGLLQTSQINSFSKETAPETTKASDPI